MGRYVPISSQGPTVRLLPARAGRMARLAEQRVDESGPLVLTTGRLTIALGLRRDQMAASRRAATTHPRLAVETDAKDGGHVRDELEAP